MVYKTGDLGLGYYEPPYSAKETDMLWKFAAAPLTTVARHLSPVAEKPRQEAPPQPEE